MKVYSRYHHSRYRLLSSFPACWKVGGTVPLARRVHIHCGGLLFTKVLDEVVTTYNTIISQMNLGGNTPLETFEGTPVHLNQYTDGLDLQKAIRIQENRKNACSLCY
ncbi:hypothetical protein [Nonlabens xiamenensis]|uniref:hypothetical protein n=1 Tax=Nonlabens xiamenensis TaxID=2341043 RepID=UPI000F6159AE|nr:hypothetical protein [Nonlabens xiamenensis]